MLKKTISFLILTLAILASFHTPIPAFAVNPDEKCADVKKKYGESSTQYQTCMDTNNGGKTSDSTFHGTCRSGFLGLTSWDCGVDIYDEDSLKTGVWQIAANVATDITIIAAYLVIGYVIYGGYLYIFSYGDPGKAANGKKTLTHAFIGLAIVMSAFLIVSTIRFALMGSNGSFSNCAVQQCIDANDLITNAIQWVIGIAGVIALIFVVYGGISYITSAGDPSKLQKAKQAIIYALIGLAIVGLAEAITAFVSGMIRNANNASSYINQTTISKELHEIENL